MCMEKEKFLNIEEAAKFLDIGKRTLFRYLHSGKIKAAKIGRWRFRKEDLEEFVENSFKTKKKKK